MKKIKSNDIQMLQFDGLSRFCNISHFISTRQGGVSRGEYASFNLGAWCNDDPAAVQANRSRLCAAIGITGNRLFVPCQTHGNETAHIDSTFLSLTAAEQEEALHGVDALTTDQPGVIVAVTTADCVPVLLYAPDKGIAAAIHAGWKGTVQQITKSTVDRMVQLHGCNPQLMVAGIGPSICKEAFEVGDEVGEAFKASGADMAQLSFRHPESGKLHLDLWEANRRQLLQAGLLPEHIEVAGICTYSQPHQFFSARRQGINSGRLLSGIGIKPIANSPF